MSGRSKPDRHLGCFVDLDSLLPPPLHPFGGVGGKDEDLHSGNGDSDWQTGRAGSKLAQLLFLPLLSRALFFGSLVLTCETTWVPQMLSRFVAVSGLGKRVWMAR